MLSSKPTIQLKESPWWLESLGLHFIAKETPEMAQQWKNRKHRGLKLNSPTTVMNDTSGASEQTNLAGGWEGAQEQR